MNIDKYRRRHLEKVHDRYRQAVRIIADGIGADRFDLATVADAFPREAKIIRQSQREGRLIQERLGLR